MIVKAAQNVAAAAEISLWKSVGAAMVFAMLRGFCLGQVSTLTDTFISSEDYHSSIIANNVKYTRKFVTMINLKKL